MSLLTVQQELKAAGFDPGPLDGLWGQRTADALARALRAASQSAQGVGTAEEHALRLIKTWEGCHLTAYPDPATGGDPWTIGWGSTGPGIQRGTMWTQAQADARLADDLRRFIGGVRTHITAPVQPHELGAMTSLAYNIGITAFARSTLVKRFNAGDKAGAAKQFDAWVRANGKVMQGLVNRRAAERKAFEGRT